MTWTDELNELLINLQHNPNRDGQDQLRHYIKSFISNLLDKQRDEIVEEFRRMESKPGNTEHTWITLDQAITKIKGE